MSLQQTHQDQYQEISQKQCLNSHSEAYGGKNFSFIDVSEQLEQSLSTHNFITLFARYRSRRTFFRHTILDTLYKTDGVCLYRVHTISSRTQLPHTSNFQFPHASNLQISLSNIPAKFFAKILVLQGVSQNKNKSAPL